LDVALPFLARGTIFRENDASAPFLSTCWQFRLFGASGSSFAPPNLLLWIRRYLLSFSPPPFLFLVIFERYLFLFPFINVRPVCPAQRGRRFFPPIVFMFIYHVATFRDYFVRSGDLFRFSSIVIPWTSSCLTKWVSFAVFSLDVVLMRPLSPSPSAPGVCRRRRQLSSPPPKSALPSGNPLER